MKNRRRSWLSFWDINAQTFGRSETRKIGQKSAKSQNADLCRKFITERKWMHFGTVVEGHNCWRMSKNCEWEILVTHLNNFWNFQLWPQISQKSTPEKFLRFLPKTTKSRMENKNMAENRNRKYFSPPFCGKNEFLGFSGDFSASYYGPRRSIFGS